MTKKLCSKCGEEKELSEFYKAKCCRLGVRPECKDCKLIQTKGNYNPDAKSIYNKKYREENKESLDEYNKIWSKANIEAKRRHKLKYSSKPESKEKKQRYEADRYANDHNYRLMIQCRRRFKHALNGSQKTGAFYDELGCDVTQLKEHLQATAQLRYGHETIIDWDTYTDTFHKDHIVPFSLFNLHDPIQRKLANHYTNLQILTHSENMSKGCKLMHLEYITPALQSFVDSI